MKMSRFIIRAHRRSQLLYWISHTFIHTSNRILPVCRRGRRRTHPVGWTLLSIEPVVDHNQNQNLCMYLYLQHGRTSAFPRIWSPDRSWRFGTIYCFRCFYDKGLAMHIRAAYLTEWTSTTYFTHKPNGIFGHGMM